MTSMDHDLHISSHCVLTLAMMRGLPEYLGFLSPMSLTNSSMGQNGFGATTHSIRVMCADENDISSHD